MRWHQASQLDPFPIPSKSSNPPREVWNVARRGGQTISTRELTGARFALWKNPEHLTARQAATLAGIARTNERLYRAYLLKEQLRAVFGLPAGEAVALLEAWLGWARRCRIPAFSKVARSIGEHRRAIEATLVHRLSNARVEAVNTRIRLLIRIAFGFHSASALIALTFLGMGGYCPALPGR